MEQQKKKKGNCRNGREEKVQYETLNKRTPKKRHGGKKKKEKMNVKMRKGAKVDGGCKNGKPRGRSLVINDVLALEHRFFFFVVVVVVAVPLEANLEFSGLQQLRNIIARFGVKTLAFFIGKRQVPFFVSKKKKELTRACE